MNRFWTNTIACGVALLCLTQFGQVATAQPAPRPNIVFIMADDLGWGDVAFHQGNCPTPHLDQLASQGLELTQHYVAPVCSPTRAGLLSGRCWSRFGVVNPQNNLAFPQGTTTLASALAGVGYDTCLIGKWHLGSLPEWGPNHFGFDHAYGSLAGGISPWNHRYKKGPYTQTWHRNEQLIEESGHVTDLLTDEAVEWIASRQEAPFLLYVPFTAVHLPLKEPLDWLEKVPAEIQGDVARHYAASVMHLDDAVGRILDAVEKSGKREQTLVVFTSDNGGSTAENNDLKYPDDHCPNGRLPGNNLPWRGQKGSLYEGGTRVPTLIHWPGNMERGKIDTPLHITDWMPTFCELAGVAETEQFEWDGLSLAGHLLHGKALPERALYAVGPSWRARSLRWKNWKLLVFSEGSSTRMELYDLAADPQETRNLADSHPQQIQEMLNRLQQLAAKDQRPY